jgi:hypothetical protein
MSTQKLGREAPRSVLANQNITTQREWRRLKRNDIRNAQRAIHRLRIGCAFIPNGRKEVRAADDALSRLADACSPENWGR